MNETKMPQTIYSNDKMNEIPQTIYSNDMFFNQFLNKF